MYTTCKEDVKEIRHVKQYALLRYAVQFLNGTRESIYEAAENVETQIVEGPKDQLGLWILLYW